MEGIPALDPDAFFYLLRRYPTLTTGGLESFWAASWWWVENQVTPHYLRKASSRHSLYAAAIFRIHYLMTTDHEPAKQAYELAAAVAVQPYL